MFLLYNFTYSEAFLKNYERVPSEATESNMCFVFYCLKINLGLVKNSVNAGRRGGLWPWKSRWEGAHSDPGNPDGRGGG